MVHQTHILLVAWGAVEVVLFGGIIFGWTSLVYIYKQEGVFGDMCNYDDDQPVNNTISTQRIYRTSTLSNYHINNAIYTVNFTEQSGGKGNYSSSYEYRPCEAQDKLFNLIYVLAVVINGVASFPNGVIWDKYGTRVLRLVGIATFIPGVLLAAFVTKDTGLLLFPSMILIAYGGYIVLMTNFQLGNLIPNKKSMIISLYCGGYDSSAFMLILIKWAFTIGLSSKYCFLIFVGVYSVFIVSTFWYMPKMKIPIPLPPGYKVDLGCCRQNNSNGSKTQSVLKSDENLQFVSQETKGIEKDNTFASVQSVLISKTNEKILVTEHERKHENASKVTKEEPSFLKEALSALFIWDVIWLTLMRLQSWSFIGRLNPALERLAGGDQTVVSHYTSVYACLQFCGIILAPLSGRLMDRKKNRKVDPDLKRIEMIEVCIASFVIDSTCGLLLAITMTIPVLEVQYVSFVFHVVHRALLYGPNSAFIAQAFNSTNFGKLFGLAMTVSAGISLIQFPLFILVQGPLENDPLLFNIFILILMIIAYGHPIYLAVWCKRKRQQYNEKSKI